MKSIHFCLLGSALAVLALGSRVVVAADDDSAKLRELERAMTAPGDGAVQPKKTRTRAIVFDNDPQQAPAPESGRAAAQMAADCFNLPSNVRTNAVDFAIQFKVNSAEISGASVQTLDQIARILASGNRCVFVEGHTDASGNIDRNYSLSRDRADSVVRYITDHGGIDRKRLIPVGKGPSELIQNLDPRDPKHRRVVFKVVAG